MKDLELFSDLMQLTKHHMERCSLYRAYVETLFPSYEKAVDYTQLPWLPVRAFKTFELRSVPAENVYKIMNSSGTAGTPSTIYLDQATSRLQQLKLIQIFQDVFGSKRFPMLVIDSESTVKNRESFSARTAAINGFSIFSRGRAFALDDDLELNFAKVSEFLEEFSGQEILVFGFTFMIWKKFLEKIRRSNLRFDFSNAVLIHGGGWKKLEDSKVSSSTFKSEIYSLIGCNRVHNYYGMIEQTGSVFMECEQGNLHAPVGSEVRVRDTRNLAPAGHESLGIIQLFSNIQRSYPGHSILTEDFGLTFPSSACSCGRSGTILRISGRLSKAEVRGCSDAINR